MTSSPPSAPRIVSMDQFRGFTVVGMILVNFLGDFKWFSELYPVLEHHNTYFSYADTIMPSFHFAVGFALRLVLLRRIATIGRPKAYYQAIRRNFGLILVSIVVSLSGSRFPSWEKLEAGWWGGVADFLKEDFWETLAIIGVTSLWVLPVIARSFRARLLFLIASMAGHVALTHWFNFKFMYNLPNEFDSVWGPTTVKGLDGGPFGILAWAVPQLVGSMAYDAVTSTQPRYSFPKLMGWGLVLMVLGYAFSCLSMLYPHAQPTNKFDVRKESTAPPRPEAEAEVNYIDEDKIPVAESPVIPPTSRWQEITTNELHAEPPFVWPTKDKQRELNYWLMGKRVVTLPFILCATGYALAVYGLFVLLCDVGSLRLGLLRTFGQNPLAAYIIHERVSSAVRAFAPKDAPVEWVLGCFFLYFAVTYLFVRYLENHRIYLRM